MNIFSGLFTKHSGNINEVSSQVHWTLRITTALCFIGHGTWGLITKAGWLPFFASQGIEPEVAWKLQPLIGLFDIAMAVLLLWKPRRIVVLWMMLWALWTAILRPLAGNLKKVQLEDGSWDVVLNTDSMSVAKMQTWEFWERAGNWGPPFMLLLLGGTFAVTWKDWFGAYTDKARNEVTLSHIFTACRIVLAALLIGHAGFGFAVGKQMLINHWQSIGIDADLNFIAIIGYAELALGALVLIFPIRLFIWIALIWKLFTEFLYVPDQTVANVPHIVNIFEWIERWGDYGVPVVMLYIIGYRIARKQQA